MTISPNMQIKIDRINALIAQGYTLKKSGINIDFRNSSGRPVSIFGFFASPAGFSWIAFFFPFAVCAQIKEWSFFYVFPYLRLLAKQSGTEEYSKTKSILLGFFLAFVSVIPSVIIDVIFELIKQSR